MGIESTWAQGRAIESLPGWDGMCAGKNGRLEVTGVKPSWLSGHAAGDSQAVGALKTV